jgi:hypothetical protein
LEQDAGLLKAEPAFTADFAGSSVLPSDAAAAPVFDGLVAQWVRIGQMDPWIATIA